MRNIFGTRKRRDTEVVYRFVKFSSVGAVATVLQYVILITLVQCASLPAVLASAIGFGASASVNYALNYRYTFASNVYHAYAIGKFSAVAIAGLIVNTAIVRIGIETLKLHYLLAQVMATMAVLLLTFTGNHVWTFRTRSSGSN